MNEITKTLLDGKAVVIEMDDQGKRIEFRGYMKNDFLYGCYRFNLPEPMPITNRGVKLGELDEYFQEMFAMYENAALVETFEPLVR
jgi:hypothetical protein